MNFKDFLRKYQKVPVVEYSNEVPKDPVVSVCVQTYQHGPYIQKCLEGILMQKTDFSFEILLGEDGSTDGTREICIGYAEKYPEKIRLFLHARENNIRISGQPTGRFNHFYNLFHVRGKFIALCDGDDYWKDPYKLQEQVKFLQNHSDFGLIHGNCDLYYQKSGTWKYDGNKDLANNIKIENRKQLFDLLVNGEYQVRTATVLFRQDLLEIHDPENMPFLMADTPLWLILSQKTKFKYIDKVQSVYRVLHGSTSKPFFKNHKLRFILSSAEMRIHLTEFFNYPISEKLRVKYNKSLINYMLCNPNFEPRYSLINPTRYEQFKLKYCRFYILNIINKIERKIVYYINKIRR